MTMQGMLEGKVAVITGAGSGVGRAAVKLWTEHGAQVIAADINFAAAEESVALASAEGQARAVRCDVSDPASVDAAVAAAVDAFGRLDIVYNNAGVTVSMGPKGPRSITELPHDEMRKVEDINVHGVIYGCQAAVRQFEKQGGGGYAIVSTASIAGLIGYGGALYGATKGAVTSLTRALAIELASKDIRVNAVCPAGMLTHYAGQNPDDENREAKLARIGSAHPLGRAIDPGEAAAAAMFLVSDMAINITGVCLPLDGGVTAGRKLG